MAEVLKCLGQIVPTASSLTDLYVCGGTGGTISSVLICNQNVSATCNFRIALALAAAADAPKQYLYYNIPLQGSDTFVATIGVTLASGDVVRVWVDQPNVSFQVFGAEVS